MSETKIADNLSERILELAQNEDTKELEAAWIELVNDPPKDTAFYNQYIRAARHVHTLETAHTLLNVLVGELNGRGDFRLAARIVAVMAPFYPESEEMRPLAHAALAGAYADTPNIDYILKATRIEGGVTVDDAIKRFKAYLRLTPGRVYSHATWGEGVIQSWDPATKKVTLDFPNQKGKVLTLEGVRDFLVYLQPDSFLALRATEPERVTSMADDDPIGLVKLVMEGTRGKIKQTDLKTLLLGKIITESAWQSWWNRVRQELRIDPMIDFNSKGGAHSMIVLREKPRTFEEEMEALFFDPESNLAERIGAVKKLSADESGNQTNPRVELLKKMLRALDIDYKAGTALSAHDKLQFAFLAEDIKAMAAGLEGDAPSIPPARELLAGFDDYNALGFMEHVDHAMRALKLLMERDGEKGFERAAKLMPSAQVKLAQAIWREFSEEHHTGLAVKALQELFEKPLENPGTYFWAIKAIMDGGWEHLDEFYPLSYIVPEVLDAMESWEKIVGSPSYPASQQATAKALLSKVRSLIQQRHFGAICTASEQMTLDQALRLRRSLQNHPALNEQIRAAAERQLVLTRRDLEEAAAAAAPPVESTIHYVTAKGRERVARELEELNTVKIPANAQEIEKARSEGDLKENAGYHGARERHVLLLQQAHELQQSLHSARVFDASKVGTETVGFGVTFEAENRTVGRTENYTALGRFETDPDQHVFSYQSPFVQQFVGKKPGDEFVLKQPDGREISYKLLSIRKASELE